MRKMEEESATPRAREQTTASKKKGLKTF